jgi:small basic protein
LFSEKTSAANAVLDSKYGHVRETNNLIKKPIFITSIVVLTIVAVSIYYLIFG